MDDLGGGPGGPDQGPVFKTLRRRRPSQRSAAPAIAVVVVILLLGGAGWYWFRLRDTEPPTTASTPEAPDTTRSVDRTLEPLIDLPELDESDVRVRELLARLSANPRWASWLVPEDLVRRFVTSVVNVAEGGSPRSHLLFMAPEGSFGVREAGERLVVDSASYRRYDALTETFVSLDTQAAARLYRQLYPLFDAAHRELGLPDRSFDGSFALAIGNILAVDVPEGGVPVVQNEAVYEYADPSLEELSPAEKHVLRLGPRNARRIQEKLRELAAAIGVTPGDARSRSRR